MPLWAVVRLSSRPPHTNSVELSKLIGSVYGEGAEAAFLALWRKHIGFFVDYSTGLATGDETKQNAAIESLLGYANDCAAFLSSANPYLPKDVIVDLVKTHAATLKAVIKAGRGRGAFLLSGRLQLYKARSCDCAGSSLGAQRVAPERCWIPARRGLGGAATSCSAYSLQDAESNLWEEI